MSERIEELKYKAQFAHMSLLIWGERLIPNDCLLLDES